MEKGAERVLVVMPCRNEAENLGRLIQTVRTLMPRASVLVVNDASEDTTRRTALDAGAAVLSHAVQLGYGAALETAYLFAVRNGYDTVLQLDGDGQHPPEELPKLLAAIQQTDADLVIGSRYLDRTHRDASSPWIRKVGQALFSRLISLLTMHRFTDATSGLQALNHRALRLFASGVFPCDYPDSDVLLMSHLAGLRIKEIPVHMLPRTRGRSMHSGLSACYYVIKMFLSMFVVLLNTGMWRRWKSHAA